MGSSGGKIGLRSSNYPALTRFYKGQAMNYNPYVYCPNCGEPADRDLFNRVVYFCNRCSGEYYWSNYGKVVFIEEALFVEVLDDDGEGEEMKDGVPAREIYK